MRIFAAVLLLPMLALTGGCSSPPPPQQVPVPPAGGSVDQPKPLPDPVVQNPGPPPFSDEPLLVDLPPEARPFVKAWNAVGRPRMALFVNRTLEGQIVPTHQPRPAVSIEAQRGQERQTVQVYLKPGQYDQAAAKTIDYQMIENLLTDWMSADNQIKNLVSPTMARKRLTDEQVKELQAGRPQAAAEIARQLDCDVLIQVQARPTRQGPQGLEVRILAEAMNIRGGESIARAAVDVPPPLDKRTLNEYTRFLARKLMDGMTGSWSVAPQPTTQPH